MMHVGRFKLETHASTHVTTNPTLHFTAHFTCQWKRNVKSVVYPFPAELTVINQKTILKLLSCFAL
jgi:hypothetical protein